MRKVDEFDTATIHAVLRAAATDRNALEALLRAFGTLSITQIAQIIMPPLEALLALFLAPEDHDDRPSASSSSAKPWRDAYAELFKIGTGWLSWTPAVTWAATLPELHHAQLGNLDQLRAIHAGADEATDTSGAPHTGDHAYTEERLREIEEQSFDPAFDREGLRALKARHT